MFCLFVAKLVEQRSRTTTINGQTQTVTYSVPHYSKKHLFRLHVDLLRARGVLNPGIYVYPFSFKLQERLPGSFNFKRGDASAKIIYKLKAEVMRPGMFQSNVKNTTIVPIISKLTRTIQKVQAVKEATVTRLCCIDVGDIKCSAILDKNAYSPGEVAHLIVSLDNTASDVSLKHVSFKLANSIRIFAGSYSQAFKETVCKNQAPGIPKGDTAHIDITVDLPRVVSSTTASSLISSLHSFDVVMSVPCSTDITLSLPVTIFEVIPSDYVANVEYPADKPPHYQSTMEIQPEMFKIY